MDHDVEFCIKHRVGFPDGEECPKCSEIEKPGAAIKKVIEAVNEIRGIFACVYDKIPPESFVGSLQRLDVALREFEKLEKTQK